MIVASECYVANGIGFNWSNRRSKLVRNATWTAFVALRRNDRYVCHWTATKMDEDAKNDEEKLEFAWFRGEIPPPVRKIRLYCWRINSWLASS